VDIDILPLPPDRFSRCSLSARLGAVLIEKPRHLWGGAAMMVQAVNPDKPIN
jgi:hypothetical protein